MTDRLTWDQWGLELAKAVALRADCSRRQVGAVLMRPDHTIVATGYNGAPSGQVGCLAGGCPRGNASRDEVPGYDDPRVLAAELQPSSYDIGPGACIAVHAEQNALLRASWDQMVQSTLYVTDRPCPGCLRTIQGSPVMRVVAPDYEWTVHP